MQLEYGEGFFLGAMSLNYAMTLIIWLLPVSLLWLGGILAGWLASVLALAGAVGFPILFYRSSRCWWLGIFLAVLPDKLPANRQEASR